MHGVNFLVHWRWDPSLILRLGVVQLTLHCVLERLLPLTKTLDTVFLFSRSTSYAVLSQALLLDSISHILFHMLHIFKGQSVFWSLLLWGIFWNQKYEKSSLFPFENYFHSSLSLDSWGWNLVSTMMVLRGVVFATKKRADPWVMGEALIKPPRVKAALSHSIIWRQHTYPLWRNINKAPSWEQRESCLHWTSNLLMPWLWTSYGLDLCKIHLYFLRVTQLLVFLLWQ